MKTQSTPAPLTVCAACKQTGTHGASWNFFVGDSKVPQKVHKPCGEMLAKTAPEGVRTALVPSPALRATWRNRRNAKGFWNNAFAKATPLKGDKAPLTLPPPATPALAPQTA